MSWYRKEKVYIAGAISHDPDYKEKFDTVEKLLNEMGYLAVNPIAGNERRTDWTYKQYIDRDLKLLMNCDYICFIDSGVRSIGMDLERSYARAVGIRPMGAYFVNNTWIIVD